MSSVLYQLITLAAFCAVPPPTESSQTPVLPDPMFPPSCRCLPDTTYNGALLDCSNAGLSAKQIPGINLNNATSLILDGNNLGKLESYSFHGVRFTLRKLSLASCNIHSIAPNAFNGLNLLAELKLNNNYIKFEERSLPFHVFDTMPNLTTLIFHKNEYHSSLRPYQSALNIFQSLDKLRVLYIDSLDVLHIDAAFARLQNLEALSIYCYHTVRTTNTSLEGLRHSNIKQLVLDTAQHMYPSDLDEDIFNPLPDLERLEMRLFHVGNVRVMKAMKGLQNKTIQSLALSSIRQYRTVIPSAYGDFLDMFITENDTRFLANVCVKHFSWTGSEIMGLDAAAVYAATFGKCVESIDISGNEVIKFSMIILFQVGRMRNLKEFSVSRGYYPKSTLNFWEKNSFDEKPETPLTPYTRNVRHHSTINIHRENTQTRNTAPSHRLRLFDRSLSLSAFPSTFSLPSVSKPTPHSLTIDPSLPKRLVYKKKNVFSTLEYRSVRRVKETKHSVYRFDKHVVIYVPRHIRIIRVDNLMHFGAGQHVIFKGGDQLQEFYMRHALYDIQLTALISGLPSVRRVDFTGTKITINENFFNYLPSLHSVILRDTQNSPDFLHLKTRYLFQNVTYLEYLDLSFNNLNRLPRGTFAFNVNLKYLCLASNRFSRIPLDLKLTPNLEILDLRNNSISSFTPQDMHAIDAHQGRVSNFTVLLDGNELVCTCMTNGFVLWLSHTPTKFDKIETFTCIAENGRVVPIQQMFDVRMQMRHCKGEFYLMLALVLVSTLLAVYIGAFFGSRYQKLVISKLIRLLDPHFKLQSREDFKYDVFIGYADPDVLFVRYKLLPILEGKWNLRTFVHHRDLRQDSLDIGDAVRDSWRCLLVVSDYFVNECQLSQHVMRTASFFVSASNLRKVMVVVEETAEFAIPDHVLQVTHQDGIVVVPDFRSTLDSQAVDVLRNRIFDSAMPT